VHPRFVVPIFGGSAQAADDLQAGLLQLLRFGQQVPGLILDQRFQVAAAVLRASRPLAAPRTV